jgi:hypothetical protein
MGASILVELGGNDSRNFLNDDQQSRSVVPAGSRDGKDSRNFGYDVLTGWPATALN